MNASKTIQEIVELLIEAALDLAREERRGGEDDVVSGAADGELRFQCLIAVVGIVADLDSGLFLEVGDRGFADVVRPVVEVQFVGAAGSAAGA